MSRPCERAVSRTSTSTAKEWVQDGGVCSAVMSSADLEVSWLCVLGPLWKQSSEIQLSCASRATQIQSP